MPAILGALGAALNAAREGMSANAFDRELRSLGMGARRSEVLNLYRIANAIVSKNPEEPFRDITQAPNAEHMSPWPTKRAEGVQQVVTLIYRDRITGKILPTYYRVSSPEGIIRETAMATAINAYAEHAEAYNQDLVGAVHTSSYRLTPFTG